VRRLPVPAALLALAVASCAQLGGRGRIGEAAAPPVRVLLIDGQNNHDWRRTTAALQDALAATVRRFEVTVSTAPEEGSEPSAWAEWRPRFADHQVVVSNYNGEPWPEQVRRELVAFIAGGGGAVMVHAANNPFADWGEFNEMIGLGWRKAEFGDRITIDDATGAQVRTPRGQGPGAGHGPSHVFDIEVRAPQHPIMRGLPPLWKHAKDQLSHGQRGPARDMTVLDSAFSSKEHGGTGAHEPITWVIPFREGRVVTTLLGHQWGDQPDQDALDCVGFRTVFTRSVEWAATTLVSIPVPPDFPTATATSLVGARARREGGSP
jgi:hypothetical protein